LSKFRILIQKAPEEGYSGQCLEIPAVIIEGETVEELEANMKESIELALESFYTV
jgi:predicted RNase H-like HicB family nuclease